MKKIILMLVLSIGIHIQTKAQPEKQFTTSTSFTVLKPTLLSADNTSSKNLYSASTNGPDNDYDYYMRKSKNQRTAGLVTLGVGIVFSGVGLLVASKSEVKTDIYGNVTDADNSSTGVVLLIAGAVSGIVSIPLMISAHANRNKAKLMLKNQPTGFGVPPNVSKDITGITMTIPIGK